MSAASSSRSPSVRSVSGGRTRPPLTDLTEAELAELTTLVSKVS